MSCISVAIDGPSASGKSTIAKLLAKRLGFIYIDTGAMYRAYTLACLKNNIDCKDEIASEELIGKIKIGFNELNHVTIDGLDVEKEIRKNDVADNVSYIASYKNIRLFLVASQREFAKNNNIIMDGRDIGTYVLQDATIKFYQVADVNERAKRRYKENIEKGIETTFEDCLENLNKRDYIDSHRSFCPLRKAEDSIEINATNLNIEDVLNMMLLYMKERGLLNE